MPNPSPTVSPFEVITNKGSKKISTSALIITIVIAVFLILGIVAGVLLVRQQQNISEKAAVTLCPAAGACPVSGQPNLLKNCNPGNIDGSPLESSCSNIGMVGVVTTCGTQQFCCPSLGSSWTTDVTLCAVATPTPTATATALAASTPLATVSASPRATATVSATPRVLATPRAIPVTGTDWPTVLGIGVGAAAIIGAILLAI